MNNIIINIISITFFSFFSFTSTAAINENARDWHYEVTFDAKDFLSKCASDPNCARALTRDSTDYRSCWKTLFALRDLYRDQNNYDKVAHTYHAMAKILLSSQEEPVDIQASDRLKTLDLRGRHISRLLDEFTRYTIPAVKNNKIKKWSHIYSALLRREWAIHYSAHRHLQLQNAYEEISKATALKTTRTTHLISAQLILDDGYTPTGLSREGAETLAREHLRLADEPSPERSSSIRKESGARAREDLIIKVARPTYLIDLKLAKNAEDLAHAPEAIGQAPAQIDPLLNFDFRNLVIPQHANIAGLPLRNAAINTIGQAQDFRINGRRFLRQNVDATDFNCFFNALGFVRNEETAKLMGEQANAIVRFMLANEILSTAADPAQLGQEVRTAIRYARYAAERNAIAALQQERNNQIRVNPNVQLRAELDGNSLHQRVETNDQELRTRALSLNSYRAFVSHLSRPGVMMATLEDVEGNGARNFGGIDAIALINNIGVMIFGPQGNLRHQFVPVSATAVQYLYHEGVHFQALYEAPDEDDDTDNSDSEDDEFPSQAELVNRYPHINMPNRYHNPASLVRLVLYLREDQGMSNIEIGARCGLDARRVSEILVANEIRQTTTFNADVKEFLIAAHLRVLHHIEDGKYSKAQLHRAVADKFNLEERNINNIYSNWVKRSRNWPLPTKSELEEIADSYRQGDSLLSIIENHHFKAVCEYLANVLEPREIRGGQLDLNLASMSEQDKEALILNAFKEEQALRKNGTPSIRSVVERLAPHHIGFKIAKRILEKHNLISQQIKSKHMTAQLAETIRREITRMNLERGEKKRVYQALAKKYGVTENQISGLMTGKATYLSQGEKTKQIVRDKIVAAYHSLNAQQKKHPIKHIHAMLIDQGVSIQTQSIGAYLKSTGLYEANPIGNRVQDRLAGKRNSPDHAEEESSSLDDDEAQPRLSKRTRHK